MLQKRLASNKRQSADQTRSNRASSRAALQLPTFLEAQNTLQETPEDAQAADAEPEHAETLPETEEPEEDSQPAASFDLADAFSME